jgi:hypothetical protein
MRTAVLIALLVAGSCVQAFAADPPKGPSLADLMKQPANRAAWYGMFAGATPPQWVDDYAKTLDGPPTPSIAVEEQDLQPRLHLKSTSGDNQLFVLFAGVAWRGVARRQRVRAVRRA